MLVRRRRLCYLKIEDRLFPDIERLAEGDLQWQATTQAFLLCPLTGESLLVLPDELSLLARLSDRGWTDSKGFPNVRNEIFASLVARRLIVSDGPESQALREEEARLDSIGWNGLAAVYHSQSSWSGRGAEPEMEKEAVKESLRKHRETYGPPPPHFVRRETALAETRLPPVELEGPLVKILKARMTARAFLKDRELPLEELGRVLAGAFGTFGYEEAGEDLRFLKKTSPSAGGLHPVEAYPIVVKVTGLPTGIYHYRVEDHTMELLEALDEEAARALITDTTAGQFYFGEAHACIIHVARFDRAFWKYREHEKMYKAILLDVAHLSQTFYLLATERGLGAYFTAVINDVDIGRRLGLDPLKEAAIGVNGLGILDASQTQRHFRVL